MGESKHNKYPKKRQNGNCKHVCPEDDCLPPTALCNSKSTQKRHQAFTSFLMDAYGAEVLSHLPLEGHKGWCEILEAILGFGKGFSEVVEVVHMLGRQP